MRLYIFRKIAVLFTVLSVLVSSSAAGYASTVSTVTRATFMLPSEDNYIFNVSERYMALRQTLSIDNIKFTIIDKHDLKVKKIYSLNFHQPTYPMWFGDQSDHTHDCRFWLADFNIPDSNRHKTFLVDILSGSFAGLPEVETPAGPGLYMSPSSEALYFGTPGTPQGLAYIINRRSGKTIKGVTPAGFWYSQAEYDLWNKKGDYTVYYKDNRLYLLNVASMEASAVSGKASSKVDFLSWIPDGTAFLFTEDNFLKLCKTADASVTVLSDSYVQGNFLNSGAYKQKAAWNNSKSRLAIQDASDNIFIYDTRTGTCDKVNIPGLRPADENHTLMYYDVFWTRDDKSISCVGIEGVWSRGYAYDSLLLNAGSSFKASGCSGEYVSAYKDYIVFLSKMADLYEPSEAHELELYSMKDNRTHVIKGVCGYEITPDGKNMIVYDDKNCQAYMLDESKLCLGKKISGMKSAWFLVDEREKVNSDCYNGRKPMFDLENGIFNVFDFNKMKLVNLLRLKKSKTGNYPIYSLNSDNAVFWVPEASRIYNYDFIKSKWIYTAVKDKVTPFTFAFIPSSDKGYILYKYETKVSGKACLRICRLKTQ